MKDEHSPRPSLTMSSQSFIVLAAVFLGLALSRVAGAAEQAGRFILPFLLLMLLGVFMQLPLRQIASAFRRGRVTSLSLLINFVWNPIFAWLLGWLFLRHQPALWLGLIMLLVTPCTDWYLVFTNIAGGNVALATALLPWNLLLQLILLPVYLLLLAGTLVPLDWLTLGRPYWKAHLFSWLCCHPFCSFSGQILVWFTW
jgi:ACR3 family arsenite efflux pump ArsB